MQVKTRRLKKKKKKKNIPHVLLFGSIYSPEQLPGKFHRNARIPGMKSSQNLDPFTPKI